MLVFRQIAQEVSGDEFSEDFLLGHVDVDDPQRSLPRVARDPARMAQIESFLTRLSSTHDLHRGDARSMEFLRPESVQLVVTSPPYWSLKRYRETDGQLGHIDGWGLMRAQSAGWRPAPFGGLLLAPTRATSLSARHRKGSLPVGVGDVPARKGQYRLRGCLIRRRCRCVKHVAFNEFLTF